MKILLDTQVFLWAITDDPRLSDGYRALYQDEGNDLFLSVASLWEMLIKSALGKLPLPTPASAYLGRQMEKNRVTLLAIQVPHLGVLEGLPPIHRDPFDRMLVAQAKAEKYPMMTVDSAFSHYGVKIL